VEVAIYFHSELHTRKGDIDVVPPRERPVIDLFPLYTK
jgi:hypothetical protein